jgi:predicted ArsR family transcriptional regulator
MNGVTRRHRALADQSRVRIVQHLRATGNEASAEELARALSLHPNTIRAHLAVLEEAELVRSAVERRSRPGRPRLLFSALPDDAEQEHALLAAALASSLEPLPDGAEIATAAGRSWGTVLVDRLEPGRRPDEEACVERIVDLLGSRGFAPERGPGELVMHRCPFRELAERYPGVVCAFHAGLIEGALGELGAPVGLGALAPWVTPTTCVATLVPASSSSDSVSDTVPG